MSEDTASEGGLVNNASTTFTGAGHSDQALVAAARTGDRGAFGALWERHADAGRRYAAAMTRAFDADDLVSEAYVKIYAAIQAGKGPSGPFRPYLLVTIRNIAIGWAKRRREGPLDDADEIPDPRATDAGVLASVDANLTARAFRSLPDRWQEVLWFTEVQGLPTADVARRLGMTVSGVGMLALRAREGLRQAWIQAHIDTSGVGSEHHWALQQVGQHVRGKLRPRAKAKFDAHLASCAACTLIAVEAADTSNHFTLTLVPLAVGILGVTSLGAFLHAGAPAQTVTADHAAAPRTARERASHRRSGVLLTTGAVAVVAIAGAAVGNALTIRQDSRPTAVGPTSSATAPANTSKPPATPDAPPGTTPPSSTPTLTPSPSQKQPAAGSAPSNLRPSAAAPSSNPATSAAPSAPQLQAPIITAVESASGTLYPIVRGAARPGASVRVSAGPAPVTVTADAAGAWTATVETGTGAVQITATADDLPSASITVLMRSPEVFVTISTQTLVATIRGVAATTYSIGLDGETKTSVTTDRSGAATVRLPAPDSNRAHTIQAAAVKDSRTGPATTITIAAQQ